MAWFLHCQQQSRGCNTGLEGIILASNNCWVSPPPLILHDTRAAVLVLMFTWTCISQEMGASFISQWNPLGQLKGNMILFISYSLFKQTILNCSWWPSNFVSAFWQRRAMCTLFGVCHKKNQNQQCTMWQRTRSILGNACLKKESFVSS